MSPETLFRLANLLALLGWAALLFGLLTGRDRLRRTVAGRAVPLLLAALYAALIALAWPGPEGGGFGSLAAVGRLFTDPTLLLAGWVHYLAFDLLVGGWIAEEVLRRGLPRWLLVPALPLTFLFGPLGLLAFALGAWLLPRRPLPAAAS
jgi:Domain of unknown function (DUF4281)